MLLAITSMESAQRGFGLSGNEAFLDQFFSGRESFYAYIKAIDEKAGNQRVQQLLDQIKLDLEEWLRLFVS